MRLRSGCYGAVPRWWLNGGGVVDPFMSPLHSPDSPGFPSSGWGKRERSISNTSKTRGNMERLHPERRIWRDFSGPQQRRYRMRGGGARQCPLRQGGYDVFVTTFGVSQEFSPNQLIILLSSRRSDDPVQGPKSALRAYGCPTKLHYARLHELGLAQWTRGILSTCGERIKIGDHPCLPLLIVRHIPIQRGFFSFGRQQGRGSIIRLSAELGHNNSRDFGLSEL